MYAYCDNNPIIRSDSDGEFWNIVAGAAIGAVLGAGFEIANQLLVGKSLQNVDWTAVAIEAASGAAMGVLMSVGASAVAVAAGKTAINSATSVAHSINSGESIGDTVLNASKTAVTTLALSSAPMIGNKMTSGRHAKLGVIGKTTKQLTKNAFNVNRTMAETSRAIVKNRVARASSKTTKHVIDNYWRIYNMYRQGR